MNMDRSSCLVHHSCGVMSKSQTCAVITQCHVTAMARGYIYELPCSNNQMPSPASLETRPLLQQCLVLSGYINMLRPRPKNALVSPDPFPRVECGNKTSTSYRLFNVYKHFEHVQ